MLTPATNLRPNYFCSSASNGLGVGGNSVDKLIIMRQSQSARCTFLVIGCVVRL